ncbi:MAG: hypothetical protein JWM04_2225 [Verrucomicrobiales bacterium]|nr:hypothetical protein [Verrucomicrobiales bacterium]
MAIEAVASGQRIRVLDPISLFECKLKLAATVDQKGRQDAHHLKIMILCVRSFLRQVLDSVITNESPVKGWLGATTRIMKLTTFTHASKAARLYAIKWFEILPHREIAESRNASIIQFREKQLPKWKPD